MRQEGVFGELLRNRTAALGDTAVGQVGEQGADDADGIDADVLIKPVVFGCDKGILQILRYLVDIDRKPVLIGMKRRDQPPVGIEDLGRYGRPHAIAYRRQALIGSKNIAKP